jgi:hypothetical protein
MSRGGKKPKAIAIDATVPALGAPSGGADGADANMATAALGHGTSTDSNIPPDVMTLVQRQPEEIAVLLRGWLADRR